MSIIQRNPYHNPYPFDDWNPFSDDDYTAAFAAPHDPFGSNRISTSSYGDGDVDWKETPDAHVYKLHLPGFNNENVRVSIEDGNILKISAEKKVEREERGVYGYHAQSSNSVFVNRFVLPENAWPSHVKSSLQNGVLTVTVPKKKVHNHHHVRSIHVE